jgi:carbonic anhydrase
VSLAKLLEGNRRFMAGRFQHPRQMPQRRRQTATGQQPFAVVLACADSRVPPEIVFDQGLGDLFVVRVAGNIADDAALASIEYAVDHLGAPLVVVMGHSHCGAVAATIDSLASHTTLPGHLPTLVAAIEPAVTSQGPGPDRLERAIDANVQNVVQQIRQDAEVAHLLEQGKVKVVGGHYDLATGKFSLLPSAAD